MSGMTDAGNGGFRLPRAAAETTSVSQQSSGTGTGNRCQFRSPHRSDAPVARPQCCGLIWTMLRMGVSDHPACALRKRITRSDIDRGQHRLLLSKDSLNRPLLEATMTPAELARTTEKDGLKVQVLDRLGREYALVLKFVKSIEAYRIMGPDYSRLVENNGFQVGHHVGLWLFRARRGRSGADELLAAGELMMAILHYETDDIKNHVLLEEEAVEKPEIFLAFRRRVEVEEEVPAATELGMGILHYEVDVARNPVLEAAAAAKKPESMSLVDEEEEINMAAQTLMKMKRKAHSFGWFDAGGEV